MRLPLFVFQERQFERPQERHGERFFISLNRVGLRRGKQQAHALSISAFGGSAVIITRC